MRSTLLSLSVLVLLLAGCALPSSGEDGTDSRSDVSTETAEPVETPEPAETEDAAATEGEDAAAAESKVKKAEQVEKVEEVEEVEVDAEQSTEDGLGQESADEDGDVGEGDAETAPTEPTEDREISLRQFIEEWFSAAAYEFDDVFWACMTEKGYLLDETVRPATDENLGFPITDAWICGGTELSIALLPDPLPSSFTSSRDAVVCFLEKVFANLDEDVISDSGQSEEEALAECGLTEEDALQVNELIFADL